MLCRYCAGTYEECGCGFGYCAHCNDGVITDPPFGPPLGSEELNILTPKDFDVIINYKLRGIPEQIEYVSIHLTGKQLLNYVEIGALQNYWGSDYMDETLGDVLNRAAWLVKQKINTEKEES